jgi:nitroreductase
VTEEIAHIIDDIIRARRTSMLVDKERPVPNELIEELCELASWAPNHKRTWPWRFAAITGPAQLRFGDTVAEAMAAFGDEPAKVDKARTKYARTPAVVVVGSTAGDSELRAAENRDATAAAIQNFMLAATARGLATYWGSCPKGANDPVAQFCGFEPGTTVVCIMYLGWATSTVEAPERPQPSINYLND